MPIIPYTFQNDQAAGKPLRSEYILVGRTGQTHAQPYGTDRKYEYGAPH